MDGGNTSIFYVGIQKIVGNKNEISARRLSFSVEKWQRCQRLAASVIAIQSNRQDEDEQH